MLILVPHFLFPLWASVMLDALQPPKADEADAEFVNQLLAKKKVGLAICLSFTAFTPITRTITRAGSRF